MNRLTAVAALIAGVAVIPAQGDDFQAEVMEWVVEPCMEVAAAYGVKSFDREQIDLGMKREHVAQIMAASRESAARELAANIKGTWEKRRAAYPLMLDICLAQVKKDAS